MSEYFLLNQNTGNTNSSFTLINNSFPYLVDEGFKYRPALRMSFQPLLYSTTSSASVPFFYPSNITIMKQQDYIDNIWHDNVEVILKQRHGLGTSLQPYYWQNINVSDISDSSSSFISIKDLIFDKNLTIDNDSDVSVTNNRKIEKGIKESSNINTDKLGTKGISFHQFIAYNELNIKLTYTSDNSKIIQHVQIYYDNETNILYSCDRILTNNYANGIQNADLQETQNNLIKQDIKYLYPDNNNHIYATIFRNKQFYNALGVITFNGTSYNFTSKTFVINIKFPNFKVAKLTEKPIIIVNSIISSVNGTYNITQYKFNGQNVYTNGIYYLQYVRDRNGRYYWVISENRITENITNQDIQEYIDIRYYSSELTTNNWNVSESFTSQYSESTSTLNTSYSSVTISGQNALEINYYRGQRASYVNLIPDENEVNRVTLKFYRNEQEHRWLYNKASQKQSIFTRTTGSDQNNNAIRGNAIQYTLANVSTTPLSFSINRPNSLSNYNTYVLYFDYLRKDSNENYLISGINNYINVPIIISVSFKIWNTVGSDLQHDTSIHYLQAFGFVDDYYQSSKRPIYLFENNNAIPFKINGVDNEIQSSSEYLKGSGFPSYINTASQYFANISQGTIENNTLNKYFRITKYRYSETGGFSQNASDANVKWIQLQDLQNILDGDAYVWKPVNYITDTIQNANVKIMFVDETVQTKQIWFQVADNEFNVSKVVTATLTVKTTAPTSLFLKITGTNNGTNYTGVYIDDKNQQFTIDNKITLQYSANSDIKLFYKITGDVYKQFITKDNEGHIVLDSWQNYREFDANNNIVTLQLISSSLYSAKNFVSRQENARADLTEFDDNKISDKSNISTYNPQGVLNSDALKTIYVTFRDQAGNTATVSKSIYYNTRLFKSKNRNLRQITSTYDLQLFKSVNNTTTLINRTDTNTASSTRNWRDIFYPASHGYPTLANGDIDQVTAKTIRTSTENYDPIVLNNAGNIVYDEQNRVKTDQWSKSKKYPAMVSSYGDLSNKYSGFVYWIIDNTGYGDITLEFEYFYLDNISYGPPYNMNLGQRPDALVVYDASDQGCVKQYLNSVGQTEYELVNTTLLKQLQIYSGSGNGAMSLKTGPVGATVTGAFKTETFATQRICLIFYSDSRNSTDSSTSYIGTGFKIKAGHQIIKYWQNFDVDSNNGLVWVHLSSNLTGVTNAGESISQAKMTYDYYNTKLKIDYDQGAVIFEQKPAGPVYATYTYYTYDADEVPPVRTFMLDADDLVDYADLNLYYLPSGTTPIKTQIVTPIYKNGQYTRYNPGKLNNYYYSDKDRGIVQFNNGISLTNDQFGLVPRGRIFADYRYHTFERLGNDGYSDFEFNDSMLIAGITTQYPDYTWGDIKIVNQGDTQLRDGKIVFLARGQVENNQIKSVLDYDRPWDVQQGTAQETYNKVVCVIRKSYAWDSYTCPRSQAKSLYTSSGTNTFPDAMQPKEVFYGRVVYCLGGSNDSYPATTAGRKTFSSEISGRFIQSD